MVDITSMITDLDMIIMIMQFMDHGHSVTITSEMIGEIGITITTTLIISSISSIFHMMTTVADTDTAEPAFLVLCIPLLAFILL